jgi:hypothetical protein
MKVTAHHDRPNSIVVYHTSFAEYGNIGIRTIFRDVSSGVDPEAFAEIAFMLTNHPEPPAFSEEKVGRCYSLSVGDVVVVNDQEGKSFPFLCAPSGWKDLGNEEYLESLFRRWSLAVCKDENASHGRYWRDLAEA